MKSVWATSMVAVFVSALSVACTTGPAIPVGMKADQFVQYECAGGKKFQARAAADGSTVRIRHEGGYELDQVSKGVYEGAGWKLIADGTGPAQLQHNGKALLTGCKLV